MSLGNRPTKEVYFLEMAKLVSTRGTCARRKVGCVLVDKLGHVLSTGYNGVASGENHCIDTPCSGASCKSGEGLEKCEAIHAEANALLQCKDVNEIDTAYVTHSPCVHCVKLLMNTSCRRVLFIEKYPHSDSERLWTKFGRVWLHCD